MTDSCAMSALRIPGDPPFVKRVVSPFPFAAGAEAVRAASEAARTSTAEAVAGGPFDTATDLDAPPDTIPPLDPGPLFVPPSPAYPSRVQAELAARLEQAANPAPVVPLEPVDDRFAPATRPRIVDGLIVPAASVHADPRATWVLIPVGEVSTIGLTGRAVGISPRGPGRWLPIWIGDSRPERDLVFAQFAADYAKARR